MSISPDSPWRGASSFLDQPVDESKVQSAQSLAEKLHDVNVRHGNVKDIEYRSGDADTVRHVFRWDRAQYDFVFEHGFHARRGRNTGYDEVPDATYYSLESYVNGGGCGGRPIDCRKDAGHCFISTTMSSSWTPRTPKVVDGTTEDLYRYEIYAPGGILVAQTLGELYRHSAQDEIAFPAGIAAQYIRSAQRFKLTSDSGNTRWKRVDDVPVLFNINFNPQSHPTVTLIKLRDPIFDYLDEETSKRKPLTIRSIGRRKGDHDDYYFSAERVGGVDHYIDAAFRSTRKNEAYIFMQGEYALVDYAPGTFNDRVVNGPKPIGKSFPSLVGTSFAEHGVDAAFSCHGGSSEAFVFSGNLCAKINYAPGSTGDCIIQGPKTIRQMFPFFRGTSFENGVDAAFESAVAGEAFLFRGSEYAHILYDGGALFSIRPIAAGIECLRNTEFERDVGAAFASHVANEAYLFKGNKYILLHFTPGANGDYIVGGPKDIVPGNWPSLKDVLPRKNRGLDVCEFGKKHPDRDQDEL